MDNDSSTMKMIVSEILALKQEMSVLKLELTKTIVKLDNHELQTQTED